MKRLLVALLLLSSGLAYAQVGDYRSDLAVGVGAGVTMNKVSFSPTVKQQYKIGRTIGGALRYTCERYFGMTCALQVEANYAELGWREQIETSTDTYERTVRYVQVPLLARLGFGAEERGVMGYVVLGPQVGFVIGEVEKRGGEWTEATLALRPNNVVEQYDMAVENAFEYGLTGGLGLEVNTRKAGHFQLEGRYYFALSDLYGNGKADTFARSANGAIVVRLAYMFDLVKSKR